MPKLNPQLVLCPRVPRMEDKKVLCCMLPSTQAAERKRCRGNSSLDEKSLQAIYSRSELDK
jgi:hypothetical protein